MLGSQAFKIHFNFYCLTVLHAGTSQSGASKFWSEWELNSRDPPVSGVPTQSSSTLIYLTFSPQERSTIWSQVYILWLSPKAWRGVTIEQRDIFPSRSHNLLVLCCELPPFRIALGPAHIHVLDQSRALDGSFYSDLSFLLCGQSETQNPNQTSRRAKGSWGLIIFLLPSCTHSFPSWGSRP